jgi:hypothetical protein
MLARIYKEDIRRYITAVSNAASSLAKKRASSGIERCIQVRARFCDTGEEPGFLEITTLETDSHAVSIQVPAEVIQEGHVVILADKLKKMCPVIRGESEVMVELKNGHLCYAVPRKGSILEAIYSSSEGFNLESIYGEENAFEAVTEGNFILPEILKKLRAMKSANQFPTVMFHGSKHSLNIFGNFSEAGHISYQIPTNYPAPSFELSFSLDLINKFVSSPKEELSLYYNPQKQSLRFVNSVGNMVILGRRLQQFNALKTFDKYLQVEVDTSWVINYSELVESLNFQMYSATSDTVINLTADADAEVLRMVSSSRHTTPSTLAEVTIHGDIPEVVLEAQPFLDNLKLLGDIPRRNSNNQALAINSVVLGIRQFKLNGGGVIKCVSLSPLDTDEDRGYDVTTLHFEPTLGN